MLQLDFAAEASKQAMPLPQRAPRRSFRWVGAAIGIAAAAGLALMVMYRAPGQSDPVVSLLGPTGNRHLEAPGDLVAGRRVPALRHRARRRRI